MMTSHDGCKVKFLSPFFYPPPPPQQKNMSVLPTNANLNKKIIVNYEKFYRKFQAPYILYTINPLPLDIYQILTKRGTCYGNLHRKYPSTK